MRTIRSTLAITRSRRIASTDEAESERSILAWIEALEFA